ncbi:hypothetical protein [Micromonospora sp. RTP1Z1]|uniref:hypothetical protein n=1 Tax=Micromonospora sp. RTP1Z1 TaxID=2994043 RepID=UPI0029C799E1|nr:hypothetical protein [Micromonospora sp. RTP1Z1]
MPSGPARPAPPVRCWWRSPGCRRWGLWHDLAERAGVPLRVIEVHWEQTLLRRAEYEPIIDPRLVVDTTVATDPLPAVLSYLA